MNKELLLTSLKRGLVAGAMAAVGGSAWILLRSGTDNFIFPLIAGIAIFMRPPCCFISRGGRADAEARRLRLHHGLPCARVLSE